VGLGYQKHSITWLWVVLNSQDASKLQAAKRFCIDLENRSESVLLAYARKRLEQLTKELSSYQAEEQKRLDHSLKVQREEDAKLTELKLKQEAERMMAEFETSLKKKVGKLKSGSKGLVAVKMRSRDKKLDSNRLLLTRVI